MTDEFDRVRRNAIRWLEEADTVYGCGRCATAAMASCYAIEETIKFAHLTWGVGERAVLGGGSAHQERAAIAAQALTDSEASAAAADVLGVSYPHNLVVSENPLEAKAARVELAGRVMALDPAHGSDGQVSAAGDMGSRSSGCQRPGEEVFMLTSHPTGCQRRRGSWAVGRSL